MTLRTKDTAGPDFSDAATDRPIEAVIPRRGATAGFMLALHLSGRALARELVVPSNRIPGIVDGARVVTAETAILSGERSGAEAEFWLNLPLGRI